MIGILVSLGYNIIQMPISLPITRITGLGLLESKIVQMLQILNDLGDQLKVTIMQSVPGSGKGPRDLVNGDPVGHGC